MIEPGRRGWRNARELDPDVSYPGIRHNVACTGLLADPGVGLRVWLQCFKYQGVSLCQYWWLSCGWNSYLHGSGGF